jgi:PIN domain nuclease of toxin-antitoxin system
MGRDEVILLDTHVLIWSAEGDARLGRKARKLIAERNQTDPFHVSAISAWEIALLVSNGRLDLGGPAQDWLDKTMKHPAWQTIPVDVAAAVESVNLPGDFHNDPADRFIVAAARLQGFAVVTADRAILEYAKAGHVKAIDAAL